MRKINFIALPQPQVHLNPIFEYSTKVNMSIKKIDSIKNMAVFKDFRWDSSVRNKNNILLFQTINILYGRNYSGKTTLSRIFRALETGSISECKYGSPEFQLSFDNGSSVTQIDLNGHGRVIRVFNEDFVKENLQFIVDDEKEIKSFAILGEDNARLEKEIEHYEAELGNEQEKTGLVGKLLDAENKFNAAKTDFSRKSKKLNDKLKHKANNSETGIKHNSIFGHPNYNITKIKGDIDAVANDSYSPLSDEEIIQFKTLLNEEPKNEINKSVAFELKYSDIAVKSKDLIQKKIQASDQIQEWLEDTNLAKWVESGREFHEGKREFCAFCGSHHPSEHWHALWGKLDKHFNLESKKLEGEIDGVISSIKGEKSRIPNLLKIRNSEFYSSFSDDLENLSSQFEIQTKIYCENLEFLERRLEERKNDIFTPLKSKVPKSNEQGLNEIRESYEDLRKKSNQTTSRLEAQQSNARNALRLHEVFKFITDIKYDDECKAIENLKKKKVQTENSKTVAQTEVKTKRAKIDDLKAQLKDESKGAERVNYFLNSNFGHPSLSLKAIEDTSGDTSSGYRFEVIRNGKKAFHLSAGERSLIAFCYFIAKLEDIETKGNQPIIWIDDPISSLDANHIFFVYSLISTEIVDPENYENGGQNNEQNRFKQLFISTHNLEFLKFLKRLSGENNPSKCYFIIARSEEISEILLMPKHLKEYVTEFNYLFHQIYKCAYAQIQDNDNYDCFYSFGNNARKFLEAFLYFKYPNNKDEHEKFKCFFGNDELAFSLTNRINNEYSHLAGVIERSVSPVEVPEMQKVARFILRKIKENDEEQYSALLDSIGVENNSLT